MPLSIDGNEVRFLNLHCGLSVDKTIRFEQGEFTFNDIVTKTIGSHTYDQIDGLIIYCDIPDVIGAIDVNDFYSGNDISAYLRRSYNLAEELITAICAKYLTSAYFDKPVTCIFKGKEYYLNDMTFQDKDIPTLRFYRAESDSLDFLNSNKNPRKLFHFYRLARDITVPVDQRVLMAWRFLESYCKRRDMELVNYLSSTKFMDKNNKAVRFRRSSIESYYKYYRSAVAHASLPRNNNHALKVIYPRAKETTYNLPLHRRLNSILDKIDIILATNKRIY